MSGEAEGDAAVPGSVDQVLLAFLLRMKIGLSRPSVCVTPLGYWGRGWPRCEPGSAPEPLRAQVRDRHSTVAS